MNFMYVMYMMIYNIIMYFLQPIVWLYLLWRSKRIPSYRKRWLQRYGFYKKFIKPNGIILHAVSLGETLLSMPLIYSLRKRYPGIVITLTSMTPTGIEFAESKYVNYNNLYCRYLPYDLFGSMRRFIRQISPKLVIVMETELWPNFINILYQCNIPCIIINARMSSYSFFRYQKLGFFISLIMKRITLIAAQNEEDASRFFKLGCQKNKLFITGNLKFDIEISQELLQKISFLKKTWVKKRRVWIAGSTHTGEEILLLQAHKRLLKFFPDLLMILVPRHSERCVDVRRIVEKIGFSYVMKSAKCMIEEQVQVVINDIIGNLMLLYGISDVAFVGGSLVKHGGHNPLEPAIYKIPILMGPYTFNFSNICMQLNKAGGLITVTNIISIVDVIFMLFKDSQCRINYGNGAARVFKYNQGVLKKLLYLLDTFI